MNLDLHPDERTRYQEQLARRAAHVAKIARLPHVPEAVLAMMVWNLLRAALPLCGSALQSNFFEWLGRSFRRENGLCAFCGRQVAKVGEFMCQTCIDECDQADQELQLHDADEGNPM